MSMRRTALFVLLAFTLAALALGAAAGPTSSASTQAETRSTPERLTADTPRVTPGGATFTVPTGWSITTGKNLVILEPPETDTHIAIVDSQAADAAAAVAAAWAAYKPEAKRPLKLVTPRPARNGWEDRQVFDYETSPNERAVVEAIAQRAGSAWTVVILDGSEPTFEKRSSPIGLILQSLRPKGYNRESFAGRKAHPLDAEHIAQIKAFVEKSMQELGLPGVSLALVDGGKLVYEGGFGVRELGKPERVDENTLFMAASNTKGMTTLLLSELVDEKKLKWDEPATQAYPTFKLGDADTTKRVLIKNLICACTGLPRQDLEWIFEFKQATPEFSLALLGTMQPTSRFGEVFQYSNLMAAAAGYIGAHLVYPNRELGAAYDEAMQQKIFDPLGMKATTFDMARALRSNHASPHGDNIDGKPAVASMAFNYSVMPHRPAGGVWTSSHDLIRYVQLELAQGKLPNGKPEAVGDVTAAAARHKAYLAKERERLVVPADPSVVTQLASRYHSKELGELDVLKKDGVTTFDFGEWKSTVASRKNDDGTISFITIDPTNQGFEFVVGERSGKRVLIIRDGQHEYIFTEAA